MKNYSKKSTSLLFESVCVLNGEIQHAVWHEKRFLISYLAYFKRQPKYALFDNINLKCNKNGRYKLRIAYGEIEKNWTLTPYVFHPIRSLQLVEDNNIDYGLKWEDRKAIDILFSKRGNCDDVLIIKNGQLTDTSYGNIALLKQGNWFTPAHPLLKGTARARLLNEKKIMPTSITLENLKTFEEFKMINALRDFNKDPSYPINQIKPLPF